MSGQPLAGSSPDSWMGQFLAGKRFLRNVEDARENGYHLVCADCGVGVFDGSEEHDRDCVLKEAPR